MRGHLPLLVPALVLVTITASVGSACRGGGPTAPDTTPPVEIQLGETAFLFVVNPVVNDANEASVPEPGAEREGVNLAVVEGPSVATDASGIGVLSPVDPGNRTVTLSDGNGSGAELLLEIGEGDLREVAVALDGSGALTMSDVRYRFDGDVVEITPDMAVQEVNDALSGSNRIVLLRMGSYTGDLDFSGSDVILFGEGPEGGNVTIQGNVTVSGSGNRLRGARITGDLYVPGSGAGLSFNTVVGSVLIQGSDAVLLQNAFCGEVTVEGSNLTALGNAGLAPLLDPSSGC